MAHKLLLSTVAGPFAPGRGFGWNIPYEFFDSVFACDRGCLGLRCTTPSLSLAVLAADFSILTPMPGTHLFRRMLGDDRLLDLPWESFDCVHLTFRHPSLTTSQARDLLHSARSYDFERNGPFLFRMLSTAFKGWRAGFVSRTEVERLRTLLPAVIDCAPSVSVKNAAVKLDRLFETRMRPLPIWRRLAGRVMPGVALVRSALDRFSARRMMHRVCYRSMAYELKVVSLREYLMRSLGPYLKHLAGLRRDGAKALRPYVARFDGLRRSGTLTVNQYLKRLQDFHHAGVDALNPYIDQLQGLRQAGIEAVQPSIDQLRYFRRMAGETLVLCLDQLAGQAVQPYFDRIRKLKEEGVEALQPYINQLYEMRSAGVGAVQPYIDQLHEYRRMISSAVARCLCQLNELGSGICPLGPRALALEIRGFLDRHDIKRLNEKLGRLVHSDLPVIVYAARYAPIDNLEFERLGRQLKKASDQITILPLVDTACLELARVKPIEVIP